MLFIKLLFSVLIISVVECVPVDDVISLDENRPRARRTPLETYKYNHLPSKPIPVSLVYEGNDSESDKFAKSMKVNTNISYTKPVPAQEPFSVSIPVSLVFDDEKSKSFKLGKSENINPKTTKKIPTPSQELSGAIPVAVVFEEERSGRSKSVKSEQLNHKITNKKTTPAQKPSLEDIPVAVLFDQVGSRNDETLQSQNQNPKINGNNETSLKEQSAGTIAVTVLLEDKGVQNNNNKLKSEKPSLDSANNNITSSQGNKNYENKKITPSQEPSSEAIPAAVLFDQVGSRNDKTLKSQNQNPKINGNKETTSNEQSAKTIPVSVLLEGKGVQNRNELKSENSSPNNANNNITSSQENKKDDKNMELVKIILKPQPRRYQLEYQIPVAVVYDELVDVQTNKMLNSSRVQPRERKARRRRPNPTLQSIINASTTIDEPENQNVWDRKREKQTQDKPSAKEEIPVVLQFTEKVNKVTQTKRKQEKLNSTPKPATGSDKQTNNRELQPKIPLQTQILNSSFKSQQKEEIIRDNESIKKRKRDPVVPIVKSDNHAYGSSGSFSYSYEGGDGTKAFEKGVLKTFEDDKTGAAVVGGFSYKDKDGKDIRLSYTADENGYRPIGDHLPTPPPIPVAIQRALEYLATKTTPASVTEAG